MEVSDPTLRQWVIIAAYVPFQAKEHVVECGGESHIAVLKNNASSGLLNSNRVKTLTHLIEETDAHMGSLLMTHADLSILDPEFRKQAAEIVDMLAISEKRIERKLRTGNNFGERCLE